MARAQCHAERRTHRRCAGIELDAVGEGGGQAAHDLGGLGFAGAGQHDRELVAAETGHAGFAAHGLAHALGDRLQELVAGRVAVAVVDVFEAVEVDQDQREAGAGCAGAGRGAGGLEMVEQGLAVVDPREAVAGRERVHARIRPATLGDVDADAAEAHEKAGLVARMAGQAPPAGFAVDRHGDREVAKGRPAGERAGDVAVMRVRVRAAADQRDHRASHGGFRLVAEDREELLGRREQATFLVGLPRPAGCALPGIAEQRVDRVNAARQADPAHRALVQREVADADAAEGEQRIAAEQREGDIVRRPDQAIHGDRGGDRHRQPERQGGEKGRGDHRRRDQGDDRRGCDDELAPIGESGAGHQQQKRAPGDAKGEEHQGGGADKDEVGHAAMHLHQPEPPDIERNEDDRDRERTVVAHRTLIERQQGRRDQTDRREQPGVDPQRAGLLAAQQLGVFIVIGADRAGHEGRQAARCRGQAAHPDTPGLFH